MEFRKKPTFRLLVEDDASEGEDDVDERGNEEGNAEGLLELEGVLHAALCVREECMSDARGQTDKCHAHREANDAEHVRDLHVLARPQHGQLDAGLVVENAVQNNHDHHEDEDVVTGLRGKGDGTRRERCVESVPHGAQENDGVDAQGEETRPEVVAVAEREVPVGPRQSSNHLVERNLESTRARGNTWYAAPTPISVTINEKFSRNTPNFPKPYRSLGAPSPTLRATVLYGSSFVGMSGNVHASLAFKRRDMQ